MELRKLEWDTDFFGFPIFSLEVTSPVHSNDLRKVIGNDGETLIYAFLKDEHAGLHDLLVEQGALFFDTRIIYAKELTQENLCTSKFKIKEYNGELNARLQELSIQAGEYSRFNNDVRLRPYFDGLYTTWIRNSLNGQSADKVFVYEHREVLDGFATCSVKNGLGWTGLIAVDSSCQSKGVGTSLMAKIENFYSKKHIKRSLVITQEENAKACRFYESCGYEVSQREFIYHWWI